MNELPEIVECTVVGPASLRLQFTDGFAATLDLAPALHGSLREPLRDPARFQQARLEDGTVTWPNGADFCPAVLRFWCDRGACTPLADVDAHFTRTPPG